MKPMLAKTLGRKFNQYPCYVQPKLNGVRALFQNGTFQSRGEKLWKPHFFPHLQQQLSEVQDYMEGYVLDGELYVHGWKLQRINSAVGVNNNNPNEDTPKIQFHVFDTVHPVINFSRRWFNMFHVLGDAELPDVIPVATGMCVNSLDMQMHFEMYTKLGFEGIMLRPDGPYEFGEHPAKSGEERMTQYRSKFLWKHKQWEDSEFYCVGTTDGEGKANIGIGALVLCIRDAVPDNNGSATFKVGTGFSDEERVEFAKNPPLGKLVRVRYLNLSADSIPLNPSFMAVME